MLRKFLLSAFIVAAIQQVSAQRFEGNKIIERTKIGVQAGLAVPYQEEGNVGYYWDDYYNYYEGHYTDAKAGVLGGIQVEIPVRNGWYIQPEVNFATLGGKKNPFDDVTGTYPRTTYDYNYLQVPILVKFKPMINGLGIFLGPQYGYLLSAKEKAPSIQLENDLKDVTYKSELSFLFGLEYYFPSANDGPQFGLSLRFLGGITNIVNKSAYSTPDNPIDPATIQSVRNNGVFLTAGVRF